MLRNQGTPIAAAVNPAHVTATAGPPTTATSSHKTAKPHEDLHTPRRWKDRCLKLGPVIDWSLPKSKALLAYIDFADQLDAESAVRNARHQKAGVRREDEEDVETEKVLWPFAGRVAVATAGAAAGGVAFAEALDEHGEARRFATVRWKSGAQEEEDIDLTERKVVWQTDFAVSSVGNGGCGEFDTMVRVREKQIKTLLDWHWHGSGDFGGLRALVSHGDLEGGENARVQTALSKVGFWAASILESDTKVGPWIQEGVNILKSECEAVMGQCEAKVRAHLNLVLEDKVRDMSARYRSISSDERTAESPIQLAQSIDELMTVSASTASGLHTLAEAVSMPCGLLRKVASMLQKVAMVGNTSMIKAHLLASKKCLHLNSVVGKYFDEDMNLLGQPVAGATSGPVILHSSFTGISVPGREQEEVDAALFRIESFGASL